MVLFIKILKENFRGTILQYSSEHFVMIITESGKLTMDHKWKVCTSGLQANKESESNQILVVLSGTIAEFFNVKVPKDGFRTRLVKRTLAILGHTLKYRVYANHLTKEDIKKIGNGMRNVEWLYDLHWYTEGGPYAIDSMPLVVEIEWKKRINSDFWGHLKYDFQKLVVSNAPLKLMVFTVSKSEYLNDLEAYFSSVIRNYKTLVPGNKFLFVAYCAKIKGFYYREIIV